MSKIKWTSLALLVIVLMDATGDALRVQGHQVMHHVVETLQVGGWIAIWALLGFNPVHIVMYILGRFVGFDLVFNLIAGNELLYVGESSLYGRFLVWFTGIIPTPTSMLVGMLKFMALIWWVAWFWTNRTFREFKKIE